MIEPMCHKSGMESLAPCLCVHVCHACVCLCPWQPRVDVGNLRTLDQLICWYRSPNQTYNCQYGQLALVILCICIWRLPHPFTLPLDSANPNSSPHLYAASDYTSHHLSSPKIANDLLMLIWHPTVPIVKCWNLGFLLIHFRQQMHIYFP